MEQKFEATFSTLLISIGSAAAMALGFAPNPTTGKTEKNKDMASFNIDLLLMLKDKTKNNLQADEEAFLNNLLNDLQLKFIQDK